MAKNSKNCTKSAISQFATFLNLDFGAKVEIQKSKQIVNCQIKLFKISSENIEKFRCETFMVTAIVHFLGFLGHKIHIFRYIELKQAKNM